MRCLNQFCIGTLLFLLSTSYSSAQEADATVRGRNPSKVENTSKLRIAIVAGKGDRSPDSGLVDLLSADISNRANISLLERGDMSKLLAEQGLKLPGEEGDEIVKAGKLLSVDLFIFLDKLPEIESPTLSARLVEARTGILLHTILKEEKSLEDSFSELQSSLVLALAKMRLAEKDRRYVAILKFVNEDLLKQSPGFTDVLAELLALDLSRSSSVVVLDRKNLTWLNQEERLTALDQRIKTSTILLRGGVKRLDGGGLRVTVVATGERNRELAPIVVDCKSSNPQEVREEVASAVISALKAHPMDQVETDPKKEARYFAALHRSLVHVSQFQKTGFAYRVPIEPVEPNRASSAANAAFALDPNLENFAQTIWYRHGVEAREMVCEYWRRRLAELRESGVEVVSHEPFLIRADPPGRSWQGLQEKVPNRSSEMIRLEQEGLALEIAHAVSTPENSNWWDCIFLLVNAVSGWEHDIDERCRYLKSIFRLGMIPPAGMNKSCGPGANAIMIHLTRGTGTYGFNRGKYPKDAERKDAFFEWMLEQDEPMLWFWRHAARTKYNQDKSWDRYEHLVKSLDVIAKIPPSHPVRSGYDWMMGEYAKNQPAFLLHYHPDGANSQAAEQQLLDSFLPIYDAIFASKDWEKLSSFRSWYIMLWPILDHHMGPAELEKWLEKTLPLVEENRSLKAALEQRMWRLDGEVTSIGAESRELWEQYRVMPVGIEPPAEDATILALATVQKDRIYFVWTGTPRKQGFPLHVTSMNLQLQDLRHHGRLGIETNTDPIENEHGSSYFFGTGFTAENWANISVENWALTGLAVVDDTVYLSTGGEGLLIFDGEEPRILNHRNGLPSVSIRGLGAAGGHLYLGLASSPSRHGRWSGGFYRLDPDTYEVEELFSSKSLNPRNQLDGKGTHMIHSVIGDDKRGCVWFANESSSDSSNGLWRYDLKTEGFTRILTNRLMMKPIIGDHRFFAQQILHGGLRKYFRLFDPDTGELVELPSKRDTNSGFRPRAIPANWRTVMLGDHLLSANGGYQETRRFIGEGKLEVRRTGGLQLRSVDSLESQVRQESFYDRSHVNMTVRLGPKRALAIHKESGRSWLVSHLDAPSFDLAGLEDRRTDAGEGMDRNDVTVPISDELKMVLKPVLQGSLKNKYNRELKITRNYWLGRYEVTQAEFEAVMGWNRSWFRNPNYPVERLTWSDASDFCKALTEQELQAGRLLPGYVYRLPTEAEWEFAARKGTYPGPIYNAAWWRANSSGRTHAVGQKDINSLGIYDMQGNVYEWCRDWYGPFEDASKADPVGPKEGGARVIRGQSWLDAATSATKRNQRNPNAARSYIGFRVCLGPEI